MELRLEHQWNGLIHITDDLGNLVTTMEKHAAGTPGSGIPVDSHCRAQALLATQIVERFNAANTRPAPVTVDQLDWEEDGEDGFVADSICGQYMVLRPDISYRAILNYPSGGNMYQTVIATGADPVAMQKVAQEHFEVRVRSVLVART